MYERATAWLAGRGAWGHAREHALRRCPSIVCLWRSRSRKLAP